MARKQRHRLAARIPEDARRTVYITDKHGNLVKAVTVYKGWAADLYGLRPFWDWRRNLVHGRIKKRDYIVADDGYAVKVEHVDYLRAILTLETGVWHLPRPEGGSPIHVRNDLYRKMVLRDEWYELLLGVVITTAPHFEDTQRTSINPDLVVEAKYLMMARDYILSGFDADSVARKYGYKKLPLDKDKFRCVLMSQVAKYFEQADITPGDIIRVVYDRMREGKDPLRDIVQAASLLLFIHPDIGIQTDRQLPRGTFEGDAKFFEIVRNERALKAGKE